MHHIRRRLHGSYSPCARKVVNGYSAPQPRGRGWPPARTRAVSGLACFACTLQSVLCRRVVAHLYVLFDEGYRIGPMDKVPFGIGLHVPDEATPARDGV